MTSLTVLHGCCTIQLGTSRNGKGRGHNTLIDASDYDELSRFNWHLSHDHVKRTVNLGVTDGKRRWKSVWMHRHLMTCPQGMKVDHKNGDASDNRRQNLRVCTHAQNLMNQRHVGAKAGFKGVHKQNRGGWKAAIKAQGRILSLGTYPTPREAAMAYDAAAIKHFGEFACTNRDLLGDY